MLVLKLARRVMALPLGVVAWAAGMLRMPAAVSLHRLAWQIGGDPEAALTTWRLLMVGQRQAEAQAFAAWSMQREPCGPMAAVLGLESLEGGDVEAARARLGQGRSLGSGGDLLDLLEYRLLLRDADDPQADRGAIERFAARRDLGPAVARSLHVERMLRLAGAGRLDDAARIARLLLEIETVGPAHLVLWAQADREGRSAEAAEHLGLASAALPPEQLAYYRIFLLAMSGRSADAARLMVELREQSPGLAAQLAGLLGGPPGTGGGNDEQESHGQPGEGGS
ncbi:MAG: hypothetical protein BIFFINMI_01431 [Phycisphaerae bacterium]|nr:hypothetical protein [Phycisphaerae bacterium]